MEKKRLLVVLICGLLFTAGAALAQSLDLSRIKNGKVRYAAATKIKVFPEPAVYFHREGLSNKAQRDEILSRIVYPVINNSDRSIAAVIVEFYPDNKRAFGVDVHWHGGHYWGEMITRDRLGRIHKDSYKSLLQEPGSD